MSWIDKSIKKYCPSAITMFNTKHAYHGFEYDNYERIIDDLMKINWDVILNLESTNQSADFL